MIPGFTDVKGVSKGESKAEDLAKGDSGLTEMLPDEAQSNGAVSPTSLQPDQPVAVPADRQASREHVVAWGAVRSSSPLQQWTQGHVYSIERPQNTSFGFGRGFATWVGFALYFAAVLSVPFLLVGPFPIAGTVGSTWQEHVLCAFGSALSFLPLAEFLCFFDTRLSTWGWYAYYGLHVFAFQFGVRVLVEQATGATPALKVLYAVLPLAYVYCLPFIPAQMRVLGYPSSQWLWPWRWPVRTVIRSIPRGDWGFLVISCVLFGICIGSIAADNFFLPQIHESWAKPWLRPLLTFLIRRLMQALASNSICMATPPMLETMYVLVYSLAFQFPLVRLVATCTSGLQLLTVFALDWAVFFCRSTVFWYRMRSLKRPAAQPNTSAWTRLYGCTQTLVAPYLTRSFRTMTLPEFLVYQYLLENLSLSASLLATLGGYGWHCLIGRWRGWDHSPLHDFWFPGGLQSALFLAFAAGLDLVQDWLAFGLAWLLTRGCGRPFQFLPWWAGSRPGWVAATKAVAVVWCIPIFLSHFAFAFWQPDHFLL